jgi:hypothetical protein
MASPPFPTAVLGLFIRAIPAYSNWAFPEELPGEEVNTKTRGDVLFLPISDLGIPGRDG